MTDAQLTFVYVCTGLILGGVSYILARRRRWLRQEWGEMPLALMLVVFAIFWPLMLPTGMAFFVAMSLVMLIKIWAGDND